MNGNITTAPLGGNRNIKTKPLFQYDYGQALKIVGVTLPAAYEVHFSNQLHGVATTQIGNADGVIIPDIYLTTGEPVYAWIYLHTGNSDGETEYTITIPVVRRASISDAEPTPVQQDVITQAIAALNTAVDQTAQDVQDATEAKQDAEEAAGNAYESAVAAAQSAANAGTYAGQAQTAQAAAELAQQKAEEAQLDAQAAQWAAESAQTAAEAAQAGAVAARTGAETAQAWAVAARSGAEAAQHAAEAARDEITGLSATANTLPAGSQATASYSNGLLTIGVPEGEKGDTGDTGATPDLTIGTVQTLPAGSSATASITGTDEQPVLNLGIPKGDAGEVTEAELTATLAPVQQDVSDLKSAIDNINYLNKTINDGKYVDSTTGVVALTGSWGYISYNVEDLAGNTVDYETKLYNGSSAGLACIATDGSYISGTNVASGTLTIPQNCAVINVSYFKQNFTANDVVFNVNISNQLAKRTIQNNVVVNIEALDGKVFIDADNFEIGDISISTTGWTYSSAAYRVRTKQSVTYSLKRGDVVSLTSYTNSRFYLGWKRSDNTYGLAGWNLADYTIQEDGEYVILLDPRNTNALSSVYGLLSKLIITRGNYAVNSFKNDLSSISTSIINSVNHRGFNTVAPENTIPAFVLSRKNGFSYVETDVQFTSDGVAVCLHDLTINRTARNPDGTAISGTVNITDITYEQALTYDFGIYKGSYYAGTKIPTLSEFLAFVRNSGIKCYIELKNDVTFTEEQVKSIVDDTIAHGVYDRCTFISFSLTYLNYIKTYKSDARLGYVRNSISSSTITEALTLKTASNYVFIDINYTNLTDSNVSDCITAEIPIEVYTINDTAEIINLNPYVTGITSDSIVAAKVLYDNAMT